MALILCLFLFGIIFPPRWGHFRVEYVFMAMMLFVVARRRGLGGLGRGIYPEILLLFLMVVSGLISIMAFNATTQSFHWRDLMSIVRYPAYAVLLMAAASFEFTEERKRTFYGFIGITALLASAISVIQFFNLFGLNQTFIDLYRGIDLDTYQLSLVYDYGTRRIIGTAGNPNSWGFCMSVLGLLLMARIVFAHHLIWLPHLGLVIASILMSGSRTATLGFIAGAFVMLVAGFLRGRVRVGSIIAASVAAALLPLAFWAYTQQVGEGADRYSTERVESLMARLEVWSATIEEYSEDFLIGRGPNKSARRIGFQSASTFHVRDNIFVSAFAQFGVVGLILLLVFFWLQAKRIWAATKLARGPDEFWAFGMVGGFVAWAIFNLMADAFFALHPSHVFLALYGITLAIVRPDEVAAVSQPAAREAEELFDPTLAESFPAATSTGMAGSGGDGWWQQS